MKIFYSLIILSGFFSFSFTQDSSGTNNKELKHGIQFQIGSLLNLQNFNNYTFSYRYRFDKNSGLRLGLLTNINEDDYDITNQVDTITVTPGNFDHNYDLKLSVQYLSKILTYNSFSLIWGGGPFISYSKIEYHREYIGSSYIDKYEQKRKTFGFGIDLILGVEYDLSDNVILSGEYGLTISKSKTDIEDYSYYIYRDGSPDRTSKEEGNVDSFSMNGLGVKLGISVFF